MCGVFVKQDVLSIGGRDLVRCLDGFWIGLQGVIIGVWILGHLFPFISAEPPHTSLVTLYGYRRILGALSMFFGMVESIFVFGLLWEGQKCLQGLHILVRGKSPSTTYLAFVAKKFKSGWVDSVCVSIKWFFSGQLTWVREKWRLIVTAPICMVEGCHAH